ncbi:hypothetical protein RB195_012891 [Necator americanus]|uniref:Uncharacterized protein n=1 Tax=Necator americanus TaxID=51031 RepID=A0ABR1DT08_NECAM
MSKKTDRHLKTVKLIKIPRCLGKFDIDKVAVDLLLFVSPVPRVLPLFIDLLERAPIILPFVAIARKCCPVASLLASDTKSVVFFFEGLRKDVGLSGRRSSCIAFDAEWYPIACGSAPTIVVEKHHVSGPPNNCFPWHMRQRL